MGLRAGFLVESLKKKIGARIPSGTKTVAREHTVTTWAPGTYLSGCPRFTPHLSLLTKKNPAFLTGFKIVLE